MTLSRRLVLCPLLLSAAAMACLAASPTPPFFAMDTIARGKADTVVPLLKELGYDGLGGTAGDATMAEALEAAGLRYFNGYLTLSFDSAQPALDDRLRGIIDRMSGHHAALWLAISKVQHDGTPFPKSSTEGDPVAVTKLRELADYARPHGVTIALYPHTNSWLERVEDAIRLANQLDRPDIGVTFNLCHWLKVEGSERDPLPVLRAAGSRLMFVTINGADTGDTQKMGWDRLIQPLGRGTYDVGGFLQKVRASGYTGPIGFQGFGLRQDPREVLTETIAAWRKMNAEPPAK